MPKPPATVDLVWNGRLEFTVITPKTTFVIDSASVAGPSPVDALVAALAGCMAMDLAHILTKGRHNFTEMRARLVAERSPDNPHRLLSVTLHFVLGGLGEGTAPLDAVRRAIALSRDTYCSVWHSLRQDIPFQVTFDVAP
jgi:putative redox protein